MCLIAAKVIFADSIVGAVRESKLPGAVLRAAPRAGRSAVRSWLAPRGPPVTTTHSYPYAEINEYLRDHRDHEQLVAESVGYYDGIDFAPNIHQGGRMTTVENRYQNEVYAELGVRPVVNAAATLTRLGGSLMAPPVLPAMAAAARNFVDVVDLGRAVGRRLAESTRNEAAYVSNGAAALLTSA